MQGISSSGAARASLTNTNLAASAFNKNNPMNGIIPFQKPILEENQEEE